MAVPETTETETNGSGVLSAATAADADSQTRAVAEAPGSMPAADDGKPDAEPDVPGDPQQAAAATQTTVPATSRTARVTSRIAKLRPTVGSNLAALVVLTVMSIIGSLAFGDSALGKACAIGFVPAFSILIGVVVTHWYSKRGLDEQLASDVQNATYTTLHLIRGVRFVDSRLEEAQEHLEGERPHRAMIEVVRAKTATELTLGTAQQTSRQWESISEKGARAAQSLFVEDDEQLRPRIKLGHNPKTVASDDEETGGGD